LKFKQSSRRSALVYEKDLIDYWQKNKIFEKSVSNRPAKDAYVFYDGPPFITGVPHHGTLLSSVTKDAVPRYWTMQGKRVERVWGWDCHGLPAEVFTEKKLGIKDKKDIGSKISLEDYVLTCRENMVQTGNEWETTIERIGRWVNFKGAYKTMDKSYMESVWWAFKKLYDAGKIYEGEKVLLYCIRDATPLSKAEVAEGNSYVEDNDPSVYVKFKISGSNKYLLAWTTTPWTLPANTAVAVNEAVEYVEVEMENQEILILAKDLVEKVLTDEKHQKLNYKIVRHFKGKELLSKSYEPLFQNRGQMAHKIWHADYVNILDGTGIVHLAPSYGEEDYDLAKAKHIPIISVLDDYGVYTEGDWEGQAIWDANKQIARTLLAKGVIFKIEYIKHAYPHCHRCGTKLIYRAHPSWFMNITDQRQETLKLNQNIHWFPEHIKNGRFAKTIGSAPDWNISRDRFWATAMPVWKGIDQYGQEKTIVVGSYQQLQELSGVELEDYHRPWVDDITFELDGVSYKRIDKVLDCWFESGSMPFAQFHYPFENNEKFENSFPGDFISEYVGQVRAWFYYVHTLSVGLFKTNAFKNVIVTGTLSGNDGRKMSKSYGNYTDPNILMNNYSADALRFLLLSSPVLNAEDFALTDKDVADTNRKLAMIWNVYDFFVLYADVDHWQWQGDVVEPTSDNILDQWILSRLNQLNMHIDSKMQDYDIPGALKPVYEFIDDVSNWYVRRSRKRFWKSESDGDKASAYSTLHYALVQLSLLLAPFIPFLSEELFRQLTNKESVHLESWPKAGKVDDQLISNMAYARNIVNEGLRQRSLAGIKLRQPLSSVRIVDDSILNQDLIAIIKDELNIKQVIVDSKLQAKDKTNIVEVDLNLNEELINEGMAREIIRNVQTVRKNAGLKVDDRIDLQLGSNSETILKVIDNIQFKDIIAKETLAITINKKELKDSFSEEVTVNDLALIVKLKKSVV